MSAGVRLGGFAGVSPFLTRAGRVGQKLVVGCDFLDRGSAAQVLLLRCTQGLIAGLFFCCPVLAP